MCERATNVERAEGTRPRRTSTVHERWRRRYSIAVPAAASLGEMQEAVSEFHEAHARPRLQSQS